jgi:glycosyltransferase involved in cell wall biosynthesis
VRILFVGPFGLCPKYTVSGRALPLAQALERRGHQVRLVIPPWDHPIDSGRRFTLGGVCVDHISLPRRVPGVVHGVINWRLLRLALSSRTDVIHIFKPKGYSGNVALSLWYLKRLGIVNRRLLVDTDDWEGPGGWNERGGYSSLARRIFAWQERWGLTRCDAVTAASRTLQSMAWGAGARRVYYLPNGLTRLPDLPLREQARSRLGLGDGPVALVYTRFVEVTPERLAVILGDLLRSVPSLCVLIVGEGLQDELVRIRRFSDECPSGGRVRVVGWVEQDDLLRYWAAADFALYACEDNLLVRSKSPLRLVEMMAAGLPVVAHQVGETEQYLEHQISGLLASPGDDRQFVESAIELAMDVSLRTRLGEAARSRIADCFIWDQLADRVIAAYREAMSNS